MCKKEKIIRDYFNSWIDNNINKLEKIFSPNVIYCECYGPEYHGLDTLKMWFKDWHMNGKVFIWDIKQIINEGNIYVVEWYFKFEYNNKISDFDGVSIIEFNNEDKIINLKEFQSKSKHYFPYEDIKELQ